MLLTHPEALSKVAAEIDDVIGQGPLTAAHVMRLTYLEATP